MHGIDLHTVIDIVTLLLAVGGGLLGSYRRLSDRISALEQTTAEHNGALKAANLL